MDDSAIEGRHHPRSREGPAFSAGLLNPSGWRWGSGARKSTVGWLVGSQVLNHGGILLVLDYKRISQSWARGLPNVW